MATYLSLERASALLGLSEETLRVWIGNGWLNAIKTGNSFTVSADEVYRAARDRGVALAHENEVSTSLLEQQVASLQARVDQLERRLAQVESTAAIASPAPVKAAASHKRPIAT